MASFARGILMRRGALAVTVILTSTASGVTTTSTHTIVIHGPTRFARRSAGHRHQLVRRHRHERARRKPA